MFVDIYVHCVKVTEPSPPPVAPTGKPSPVAVPQAQSAPNDVKVLACFSHSETVDFVFTSLKSFSVALQFSGSVTTSGSLILLSCFPFC